jgi:hypothetical protein
MLAAIFATTVTTHKIVGCVETSKRARTASVSGPITIFDVIGDFLSATPQLLIRMKVKNVSLSVPARRFVRPSKRRVDPSILVCHSVTESEWN